MHSHEQDRSILETTEVVTPFQSLNLTGEPPRPRGIRDQPDSPFTREYLFSGEAGPVSQPEEELFATCDQEVLDDGEEGGDGSEDVYSPDNQEADEEATAWNEEEFYQAYGVEKSAGREEPSGEEFVFDGEYEYDLNDQEPVGENELRAGDIPSKIRQNKKHIEDNGWQGDLPAISQVIGLNPPAATVADIDDAFVRKVYAWQEMVLDGTRKIPDAEFGKTSHGIFESYRQIKQPLGSVMTDASVPSQTLYVPITVGSEETAPALSSVFIPDGFRDTPQVDIILYFTGHKVRAHKENFSTKEYLSTGDFNLREQVNASSKNIILVAPTLGPRSEWGALADPVFFDQYLDKIVEALRANYSARITGIGQIILAAHSGGGKLMLKLLSNTTSLYMNGVRECWGFDSLYWLKLPGGTSWEAWLKANPEKKFYNYVSDGTTTSNGNALQKAGLGNFLNILDRKTHDTVPKRRLAERINHCCFLKNR